jgi:Holliday junction DNA helicase RuvA
MIGRLRGQVAHRGPDHVMLDVAGVGYVVHCSEGTLLGLPPVGGTVALWTDMVVREDLMQLFGFPTQLEREWHRLLTSVQGVGARLGLAILGALGPDAVGRALALAQAGLDVAEFAPNAVKKAVVGAGRAEKAQVAAMVAMLLPGARATAHDAWDALAIAIARAHLSEAMVAP